MSDAFDPQATEEEASSRSQLMSWRDLRVLGVVIVLLLALLYPVYLYGRRKSYKAVCVQNVKAIFDALNLYAKDHDDGLPPLYRADERGRPLLGATGLPYTWASDIAGYMNKRASFRCPAADPSEVVLVEGPEGEPLELTYGMYAPYGGVKTFNIENPDGTILVAETANLGALGTMDPKPYRTDGKPIPNGFVIGWDDSNFQATLKSQFVTRLAFRDASKNLKDAVGRHDEGIHALTATGERLLLDEPDVIRLQKRPDKLPGGYWNVPSLRK